MTRQKPKRRPPPRKSIAFHRGVKLRVPNHPPEFTSRPWFPITLRIDSPGTTVLLSQIRLALLTQLGFGAATTSLCFRFQSVRLWGPIPITPSPLIMIIYDLLYDPAASNAEGVLEQITDYPDAVNRARVGYRFSDAQYQISRVASTATANLFSSQVGAGTGAVMYINCLWRLYTTTPE